MSDQELIKKFMLSSPKEEVGKTKYAVVTGSGTLFDPKLNISQTVEFGCNNNCPVFKHMRTRLNMGNGCLLYNPYDSTKFKRSKNGWASADLGAPCTSHNPRVPIYDFWRYNIDGYLDSSQTELSAGITIQEKRGENVVFVSYERRMLVSGYVNE